jgi:hypothetical protein
MIFCSNDRFIRKPPGSTSFYYDTAMEDRKYLSVEIEEGMRRHCRNVNYDAHNPEGNTQAFTMPSDYIDKGGYAKATKPKHKRDYMTPRPHVACSIDVCTWFLHKMSLQGWAPVSKDRITQTQQDGFRGGLAAHSTPVDYVA